jgi:phosphopantothenate-cysteine ligase
MNVLITAGGTTEKIDNVRSISNISTGRLGALIADCFSVNPSIEKIFYVCSKTAIKPEADKIEIVPANSVSDLEAAVKEVLSRASINIIIHAMAVSDYRVKAITTVSALLEKSEPAIDKNSKISSDLDDMVLLMERTPKIISLFKTLAPKSMLIGFKLLDNAELETLIDKGFEVLTKNQCSFVLANDLKDITSEQHIGYLIDKEKNFTKYMNKSDIAAAIVSAAITAV